MNKRANCKFRGYDGARHLRVKRKLGLVGACPEHSALKQTNRRGESKERKRIIKKLHGYSSLNVISTTSTSLSINSAEKSPSTHN